VPDRLLIRDANDPDVAHLVHLAAGARAAIDPLPAPTATAPWR
jgi:hypothetical protein